MAAPYRVGGRNLSLNLIEAGDCAMTVDYLRMISGTQTQKRGHTGSTSWIQLACDVRNKQNLIRFKLKPTGDVLVAFGLVFGSNGRVEIAVQVFVEISRGSAAKQ